MDAELGRAYEAARRLTACDQASNGAGALFDTGDSYGTGRLSGRSEVLLGEFGERHRSEDDKGEGEEALLATKLATYPWRVTRGSMVSACEASLRRLKVDKVGLAQIHWPASNYNPLQEQALWRGLGDIHDGGLARAVGVSNYGPKQLKKIHAWLAGRCANLLGRPQAVCLTPSSLSLFLLEGGPSGDLPGAALALSHGPMQKGARRVCADLGVTLIAYSPRPRPPHRKARRGGVKAPTAIRSLAFRKAAPKCGPLLRELERVGEECGGLTQGQVALAWCVAGTVPIPGAKTAAQVEQNFGALGADLTASQCAALERAAEESGARVQQNIFQTE